ncbi:MAG: extracellular solute-binding protein [Bacillota bacterium]
MLVACAVLLALTGPLSEAKTTTLEFWTISLRPMFDDYINGLIREYEKANPGIRIEWKDFPITVITQKLTAAIAGGVAPDVVNLNTGMALSLAERRALVNIGKEFPQYQDTYFEGLWNSARLNDGVYAFPWYVVTHVVIYNKDIFARAGLDPNKPPSTWEEVEAYARQIKAKTGLYGWMPFINFVTDLIEMRVALTDETRKRATFNTPEAVARLQWYRTLMEDDIIPRESLQAGYAGALDRYMAGKVGMIVTGPQFLSRVKANAPDIYKVTGVGPYPMFKGGAIAAPLMNLTIPGASKNWAEAAKFAAYVTGDEAQLAFCKIVTILPSTKKAAADPFFTQTDDTVESVARMYAARQMQYAVEGDLTLPHSADLAGKLGAAVEAVVYGEKGAKEALDQAAAEWNKILAKER